ncbi:exocyst complex component 7-like isoform X2 [Xenia sp. Carnegie-2017]|uniref:exocyst complex component 7-like isoform X1 n=1 Tax=Xenia sp. Carnegie-2017 TaxID=2897299 RepID=UPI001F04BD67|nr:exocyst complex component 7-like isoform X1 [Xenia sp. Carnegie-2017]XP_046854800.1 exocyst complex component 7-like isoform X2 [Xenia sp. Carnegie-2017]
MIQESRPEHVSQRKKVLAEKLSKEQANLSFLKDSLTKSDDLTENMRGILSSFNERLSKLEENILPVHKETVELQRRQRNIDKVLRGLDNVISYHNVASKEDQDIRDGPGADVDSYIQSLIKVQDAIKFFEDNNPNSPELSLLTSLMETGREQMERSFRQFLALNSSPLEAETLIDLLNSNEETEESTPQFKPINDEAIEDLSKIAAWLVTEAQSKDFMNVYSQIRSSVVMKTLQGLVEGHSLGKIESYSPANIMISPKLKQLSGITPQRKSTMKRNLVRRVPSKAFEYTGNRKVNSPAAMFDSSTSKEDEDEIEAGRFITLSAALLKLLQSERTLINLIICKEHRDGIFDVLIQNLIETLIVEGEVMENSARKLIAKREYFSLLPLLPVLKYVKSVLPLFSQALQGVRTPTQAAIPNLFVNLESVGAKALDDFTENIKHDPDKQSNMPKDGTVHELTSNTLIFLEHLLGYTDTVGNMLLNSESVMDPRIGDSVSPKTLVARYFGRVLGALGLNLELKSKSYVTMLGQVALSGIFLLNNYNYILKGLQRYDISTTARIVNYYRFLQSRDVYVNSF